VELRFNNMINAAGICFHKAAKVYWFDPAGLELRRGEKVIVETASGQEMAEVKIPLAEVSEEGLSLPLKPVLRRANTEDQRKVNENKLKEQQAFRTGLEKIRQFELPMKLIFVECAFDRSRMVFHFSAENRVDFRELAKELARTLHCRVELHQIGVRDETKLIGGLGTCGKELCCATFLTEFEPVGIKMAKEQDLSLNPQKISGVCGRLMCCIAYEHNFYVSEGKKIPRIGEEVKTPDGKGKISGINIFKPEVSVLFEDGRTKKFHPKELR